MKINDYIFIFISIITAGTFCIISLCQLEPISYFTPESSVSSKPQTSEPLPQQYERQHRQRRYRRGRAFSPTGKPVDVEQIKKMIQRGNLSNKEALFYKPLKSSENNKDE